MKLRTSHRIWPVPLILLALLALVTAAGCGGGGQTGRKAVEEKSLSELPEVVGTAKGASSQSARDANLRAIDSAIDAYYTENGTYPTSLQQLVPTYLQGIPVDPMGGAYYIKFENGQARAAVR